MPSFSLPEESPLERRSFLGSIGWLLASGSALDARADENAQVATGGDSLIDVPVRETALEPRRLGNDWSLGFDVIIDDVSAPLSWTIHETASLGYEAIGLKTISKELKRKHVKSVGEFDYYREQNGERQQSYFVAVTIFRSLRACRGAWDRSFARSENGGYVALADVGECAFESLGQQSLKGKVFARRHNVVFSVVGFGSGINPKELAGQFDAHVMSLL